LNEGNRNNLKGLTSSKNLPEEIVKVEVQYYDEKTGITTPLELWAGFIGLEQNMKNYALTPKIGWMIRKKDVEQVGLQQKYEYQLKSKGKLAIRVNEIPEVIFALKEIKTLEIQFIDRIIVPDQLANIKIQKLVLEGKASKSERDRIRKLFPDTEVTMIGLHGPNIDASIETVAVDEQEPNLLIVKGKVVDDNSKRPLRGVFVKEKSNNISTQTDSNGNFSIKVEQGKTLVFSYLLDSQEEVTVSKEMVSE